MSGMCSLAGGMVRRVTVKSALSLPTTTLVRWLRFTYPTPRRAMAVRKIAVREGSARGCGSGTKAGVGATDGPMTRRRAREGASS